jgi:hypothetical protein
MFIRCIVKPVYDSQHRDAGKEALINIEAVDYFNVEYDDCIYAYTKNDERYLISYYASRKASDGETPFDMLCTAIRENWQTFCGITVTDEESEKIDAEMFKEHLSELSKKLSKNG